MIFSILIGNFSAKTAGKTQTLTEPTVVARSSAVFGHFSRIRGCLRPVPVHPERCPQSVRARTLVMGRLNGRDHIQWVMDFHGSFLVPSTCRVGSASCGSNGWFICSTQNLVVPTIINLVVWMKLGNLPILPHMRASLKRHGKVDTWDGICNVFPGSLN